MCCWKFIPWHVIVKSLCWHINCLCSLWLPAAGGDHEHDLRGADDCVGGGAGLDGGVLLPGGGHVLGLVVGLLQGHWVLGDVHWDWWVWVLSVAVEVGASLFSFQSSIIKMKKTCVGLSVCVCSNAPMCMCVCARMCVCTCVYVCLSVYVPGLCVCVCVCVCVHVRSSFHWAQRAEWLCN